MKSGVYECGFIAPVLNPHPFTRNAHATHTTPHITDIHTLKHISTHRTHSMTLEHKSTTTQFTHLTFTITLATHQLTQSTHIDTHTAFEDNKRVRDGRQDQVLCHCCYNRVEPLL